MYGNLQIHSPQMEWVGVDGWKTWELGIIQHFKEQSTCDFVCSLYSCGESSTTHKKKKKQVQQ